MVRIGDLLLTDKVELACGLHDAFDTMGFGGGLGWRLPKGRALEPGAPVMFTMPLPEILGGHSVEFLGRVAKVRRPDQIVIQHTLPWRGSVQVSARSLGADRCEVRLSATVEESAMDWMTRLIPVPALAGASPKTWRIGVLTSASGPASVFSAASVDLATMAVEEINASGGVVGRRIEAIFGDDGTHPGMGAAELVRLAQAGCSIIVTNVTSVTFRSLQPVARRLNVLLVHAVLNEGGKPEDGVVRLGERPGGQLSAALPALMKATSGSRFFLAGSNYCWPRSANRAARRVIDQRGGRVMAESYLPFGSTDYSSVISAIKASGADLVVSTFVGSDEVAFEQQAFAAGLKAQVQTLSLVLDESTHDYIGPAAAEGLWSALSYFQGMATEDNNEFLRRYRARFGPAAAPVSSLSSSLYEGLHLVAMAARLRGSFEPREIADRLREGVQFSGPRGDIRASWQGIRQTMYVAQSRSGLLTPLDDVAG